MATYPGPAADAPPPLPIVATVLQTYRTVLGDADRLLRTGGLWVLATLGLTLLLTLNPPVVTPAAAGTEATVAIPAVTALLLALLWFVQIVGSAAIAVAWHRAVLLREEVRLAAPLTARVVAYVLAGLFIGLVVAVPILLVGQVVAGLAGTGQPSLAFILGLVGLIPLGWIAARLSVSLPARAVADRRTQLATAWQATRGRGWSVLAIYLLALVPTQLALLLIDAALRRLGAPAALGWITQGVALVVVAALGAVALTLIYRRLITEAGSTARFAATR